MSTIKVNTLTTLNGSGNITVSRPLAGSGASLTALNATELGSGTVPDARFPATLPAASGVNLTALNATQVTSGTLPMARLSGTLPALNGSALTALNATQVTSGTLPIARIADDAVTLAKMADDAIGVAQLSATGTASNSTFLRGDNAWAAAGGGKVVQYAKVKNTAAVQLSSTTMTDLTGVTVTLTGVTIGNILEISGIVPIRKNTGYYTHPGVGIKIDNTLIDNSTWGTGVHMTSSDVWITKFPVLTFHTATATSHTIKMCGNAQAGQSIAFGGEMSGSTAHDYSKIWMIVKELDV